MYLKENLKKTFETLTRLGKPAANQLDQVVRRRKPQAIKFADDGATPNNPKLPFLHYRSPVRFPDGADPAAVFEELFRSNGWGKSWRNGIFDYLHYHSQIHEVLGIARGKARVRFGGDKGRVLEVSAGDAAVLPAGTGHQLISASRDLLVVGAYPPTGSYDECRGRPEEHERALKTIPKVPLPKKDPVYGKDGPLLQAWSS